jgi:DNA-binding response OmpR family regulator
MEHVWDFAFDGDPHVVTVYVAYLRDKIDRPFGRASLETVRAMGYRLRDDQVPSTPH